MPESDCLAPDWKQPRPAARQIKAIAGRIALSPVELPAGPAGRLLERLRRSHRNGGAQLAAFTVGADRTFDWFASRNRLDEEGLLDLLLAHAVIRTALADLQIAGTNVTAGLELGDAFLLDGKLARVMYSGGAYTTPEGDGRREKELALEFCDALFGLRFGEATLFESHQAWTPWFKGIAWDLTAVIFDRRLHRLSLLAVTDTD